MTSQNKYYINSFKDDDKEIDTWVDENLKKGWKLTSRGPTQGGANKKFYARMERDRREHDNNANRRQTPSISFL